MASISGVSGTLTHGSSVTISGSAFGSKSTPAPIKWDNCETGEPGDTWSTVYPTSAGGLFDMQYITPAALGQGVALPHNRGTRYAAGCHRFGNTASGGNFVSLGTNYTQSSYPAFSYWSAWVRVDPGWSDDGDDQNFKHYSVNNDSQAGHFGSYWYINHLTGQFFGPGDDVSYQIFDSGGLGYRCQSENVGACHSTLDTVGFGNATNLADGWVKQEILIRWDRNPTGRVIVVENGDVMFDLVGETDQDTSTTDRAEMLGNYARARGVDNYRYFKDIYFDRTWARVILGNASTLAACTVLENQLPSAWSSTSITATLNLGAFANDANVYMFVVDSNNSPSAGFALTLGGGGEEPPPDGPRIVRAMAFL